MQCAEPAAHASERKGVSFDEPPARVCPSWKPAVVSDVVSAGEVRGACSQLCRCPLVLADYWRPLLVTLRGLIGQVLEFCSRAAGRQGSSRRRRRAPTRSGPPAATAGRRRPLSTNRSVFLAFVSALPSLLSTLFTACRSRQLRAGCTSGLKPCPSIVRDPSCRQRAVQCIVAQVHRLLVV